MKRDRKLNPFGLAFLDIMACGFGAVTLLFLILRHNADMPPVPDANLRAEVNLIEEDIRSAEDDRARLRNTLQELEEKLLEAKGLNDRVLDQLREERKELSIQSDPEDNIDKLRKDVEELELEIAELEEGGFSDNLREFKGDGDRQYLTGLKLGGERVLILVDASASMLDDTIVNAIRRRNMPEAERVKAPKWQWTVRTTEWLVAQMPATARFQIMTFNTQPKPVLEGTETEWLDAADSYVIDRAIAGLNKVAPADGTSLVNALAAARKLDPFPDNIFLLTDGLPTQGEERPRGNTVSEARRYRFFIDAIENLPQAPVNIILFPMEGDPRAAASYWSLALATQGAFLVPSRDWP